MIGKTPWNAGKQHSEETKQRIAAKTREAMLKKKMVKALELGMTVEDYELHKKKKPSKAKIIINADGKEEFVKKGLTEEGRKRISESLKNRWKDPAYR